MSLPSRRQRSSTTPLKDAKEAIENENNLNVDDCYQLLSDSLAELSEEDRLTLVQPCINSCWGDGLTSIIADLPVDVLDTEYPLRLIAESRLTENQMVRLVKPLLLKGCDVDHDVIIGEQHSQKYVMRRVNGKYNGHFLLLKPTIPNSEYSVALSQYIVRRNLSSVLKLLLPELQTSSLILAAIEAFGSNERRCCETLVDHLIKHRELRNCWTHAIALCCAFDREDFLEMLLAGASDKVKNALRGDLIITRAFCVVPSDFNALTALEAAVVFDHSRCVRLLLANNIGPVDDEAIFKMLNYCASNGICQSACELIRGQSPNLSSWLLQQVLDSFLKFGGSEEVIKILIRRLERTGEYSQDYLNFLMSRCAINCWWHGLFALVNGGASLLGYSDEVIRDVENVMNKLVTISPNNALVDRIITSLAVCSTDMDLEYSLYTTLHNGKFELFKFLLSLNNKSVKDNLKNLRNATVNEQFLRLIDDAIETVKVKMEVKEEEEEQEEEKEEKEKQNKKPAKKKPTPKTTKAKQPKAKAAKSSSAKRKPAAKKAGKTATKKK